MISESPFILSRFEYESQHLYFLPETVFKDLENPKPTQLIGTRGTGKTTLLQALTWSERLGNQTLKHAIGGEPFAKHYIGVYLKLPDTQLREIDEWLETAFASQRAMVFGIYLDLLWLELLLEALAELVVEECFVSTAGDELKCIRKVLEVFHGFYDHRTAPIVSPEPRTFKELEGMFRRFRRGLERHAFARTSLIEAMSALPVCPVGEFGRKLATALASFCDEADGGGGEPWHFKVCMDESEILSDFQMRVVNTMVRTAAAPVFYVFSFVAPPKGLTLTLMPDLTLSEADRQLIVLDEMNDATFKELTTGVANVRVRVLLGNSAAKFNPRDCLGRININSLLKSILESSVDPIAKKLLDTAKKFQTEAVFGNGSSDESNLEDGTGISPIYQTYLVQKLGLFPPASGPNWQRRNDDSAKFRKRMVAAYLSICRDFGVDVRYASAEMVLHLSDRCIRDFLAFMHEIFIEADVPLNEFLTKTVAVDAQNRGIKRASKNKRAAIAERGVAAPTETGRLIDALAQITQMVQTESKGNQHLRASERGIFDLLLGKDDIAKHQHLLDLISDAGETGFLRIIDSQQSRCRFRVHKSLAPAYGFSYRGAYYSCRLDPDAIEPLLILTDGKKFSSLVREIGQYLAGTMPLDAAAEEDIGTDAPLFEGLE